MQKEVSTHHGQGKICNVLKLESAIPSNLMAPIIYCFCSNCSCPASALVSLASGQEEEEGGENMDQGQRVTRMELERNTSSMELLLFLLVLICLILGISSP